MEFLLVAALVAVVALLLWSSRTVTKARHQALEAHERRRWSVPQGPGDEPAATDNRPRVVDPKTGQEVIVAEGETPSRALQRFAQEAGQAPAGAQHGSGQAATRGSTDSFRFAGIIVRNGNIAYGAEMQPVSGTRATVETAGQLRERTSLTQTVAGGLLFGPVGAIIGALVKGEVDERELYLLVEGQDYAWAVDVNPTKGAEARKFAARVNTAARPG